MRTKSWEERRRKDTQAAATKKLETELKEEKQAEIAAYVCRSCHYQRRLIHTRFRRRTEKIRARRKAKEERERLEIMKAKVRPDGP